MIEHPVIFNLVSYGMVFSFKNFRLEYGFGLENRRRLKVGLRRDRVTMLNNAEDSKFEQL